MSQQFVAAPFSAPESSAPPRFRLCRVAALFGQVWELMPAPGSEREDYQEWLKTFCQAVRTGMTAGAESAYLQKQVERVLKALSGRFDLASAMGVEGFADVFGPVLERRAEESRKRPRSEGIPAVEPSVTALGVQPRQSGSTQHAAEAIGLSNSSHAARPPSRDTDSSQAVEEDAGQQVQPTLKKARTAKGKARQDKPSEEEAVVRSEVEDSGRGGQGPSNSSRRVIPQVPALPLSRAAAQGFEGDDLDKLNIPEEDKKYIRVLRQERELMYLRLRAIQEAIEANKECERELTGVDWGEQDLEPEE